ncbi:DUF2530 domain-containing protein [Bifidobacterium tsurumiense]|uniref:DUF2530 domain-containing protein n=1 Tax=Bifidobacterium tsurumiense TaxID=356829 RepID=UPI000419E29B|nr:DUF2530 domain-containing protein [Bifidobacterium tsurumiense]MDY4677963.1 DUF2530 domain-containing protein [Bifidobacterium tsurumiense]MSS12278.1 DUF2530 domain-containing protein [Bifidobacterium tsurumiense]
MKFAAIFDPDVRKPSPKPVRVDLRTVFTVGTLLWLGSALVLLVMQLLHFQVERALFVSVAGLVIGILMLVWEHFDRWDYRRLGQ